MSRNTTGIKLLRVEIPPELITMSRNTNGIKFL